MPQRCDLHHRRPVLTTNRTKHLKVSRTATDPASYTFLCARLSLPLSRPLSRSVQEDLWGEGEHNSPRFTLLVVDVSSDGRASTVPCAVVLIPRDRARDFTFSSREGLHQVRDSAAPLPS